MLALVLVNINLLSEFEVPVFAHSRDIMGPNFFNGYVTLATPIWGLFVIPRLTVDMAYTPYKI